MTPSGRRFKHRISSRLCLRGPLCGIIGRVECQQDSLVDIGLPGSRQQVRDNLAVCHKRERTSQAVWDQAMRIDTE